MEEAKTPNRVVTPVKKKKKTEVSQPAPPPMITVTSSPDNFCPQQV
jgi:hypothetical protein